MLKVQAGLESHRREAFLAISVLVFATLVYLRGSFLLGSRLLPADLLTLSEPWRSTLDEAAIHNYNLVDPIQTHYPRQLYFWNAVKRGHFPVWNPYIYLGIPSDPMTVGVFADTGQWITGFLPLFLPLPLSLSVTVALRLVLSGLFMYLLMRYFKSSFGGALLAAMVFMFGGNTVVWLEFNQHLAAQLWMPLVLLFFDRMLVRRCWTDALLATVFLTLMLYNRYLQLTLYMLLVLILLLLWRLWETYRHEPDLRLLGRMLTMTMVVLSCAALMASVKILTYYQTTMTSIRGTQTRLEAWALPFDYSLLTRIVSHAVTLFLPGFYGDSVNHKYWGPDNIVENMQYIGLVPLYLAAIAAATRATRQRGALFFAGLSACFYMVRMKIPPFATLAALVPLLNKGAVTRLATVVAFLLAIVAGLGLTALEKWRDKARTIVGATVGTLVMNALVVGAAQWIHREEISSHPYILNTLWISVVFTTIWLVLLGLFLTKRIGQEWLAISIILLTFTDLFITGSDFNTVASPDMIYPPTQATDFLRRDPTPFRVLVLHPPKKEIETAPSDTLQAYQIPEIGGRNPLLPQPYYDFISQVMEEPSATLNGYLLPSKFDKSLLWGMLNVKYVLSQRDLPQDQLSRLHLVYANELKIYRNKDWMPRVFTAPEFRVLENQDDLLEALKDPAFNPRTEVLLLEMPRWVSTGSEPCVTDEVRIDWVGTSDVEAQTCLSGPNLLVLSGRYDPDWRVYVDGERREVYQANDILMAVPVEAGEHTVRFAYESPSRWWNLAARTIPSLLIAGAFWVLTRRAERKGGKITTSETRWPVVALAALAAASFAPALLQAPLAERDLPPVSQAVETTFGNAATLEGVILDDDAFASEGQVELTLHWRALQSMDISYTVFVHLFGPDGAIHAQRDAFPLNGGYPTNVWQPGEVVADHYVLIVPQDGPPGEYRLVVGLYDQATMERLPAIDAKGERWDGDGVRLDAVLLKPGR
jgi:hypothetical protein